MKRLNEQVIFEAKIHGLELDNNKTSKPDNLPRMTDEGSQTLLFGDPETDYNHLSEEEKEEKTLKMMGHFRNAFAGAPLGG